MSGAARVTDMCTGHRQWNGDYCDSEWPPRPAVQGSKNVFINNLSAHRETDLWDVHCCDHDYRCHDSVLARGSRNVLVNNLQLGRCGDPIVCTSNVATCSNNVIIN